MELENSKEEVTKIHEGIEKVAFGSKSVAVGSEPRGWRGIYKRGYSDFCFTIIVTIDGHRQW